MRGKKRDAMEIERLNIATDQIIDKPLDNCLLLISDGTVKKLQLPDYAELKIKVVDGKITLVENTQKHKF